MRPSEVRARVLEDHDGLRGQLERLEALAEGTGRGEREGEGMRRDARALLERLLIHMQWEERFLLPALREADAWGEERAERLLSDHREQRQLLDFILSRLRDAARPEPLVVTDVVHLIAFLREDMVEEERDLLDERVLRDDVVAIDVEAG